MPVEATPRGDPHRTCPASFFVVFFFSKERQRGIFGVNLLSIKSPLSPLFQKGVQKDSLLSESPPHSGGFAEENEATRQDSGNDNHRNRFAMNRRGKNTGTPRL
jgi:hypothetical protein